MAVSLVDTRGVEDRSSWEKRLSRLFIAVQLALCGVGFWDRAEALVLLEREEERTEMNGVY